MEEARPDVVAVNAMVGGYEAMRMKERIERVTERVEARLQEQQDDEVRKEAEEAGAAQRLCMLTCLLTSKQAGLKTPTPALSPSLPSSTH